MPSSATGSGSASRSGASTVEEEAGAVTVVHTKLGTSPSAHGRTDLVTLTLRAVQPGRIRIATVDLAGVDEDGRMSSFDGAEAVTTASHGFRRGDWLAPPRRRPVLTAP